MASSPSGITVHTILSFIPAAHSLHIAAHRSSSLLVLSERSRSLPHALVSPLYTAACCYKPQLHPTRCCALYITSLRSQALLIAPNRSSSPLIAPTPLYKLYTVSATLIALHIALHRSNTPNSPSPCPKSHPTRLSLVSLSSHRPTTLSGLGMRRLGS